MCSWLFVSGQWGGVLCCVLCGVLCRQALSCLASPRLTFLRALGQGVVLACCFGLQFLVSTAAVRSPRVREQRLVRVNLDHMCVPSAFPPRPPAFVCRWWCCRGLSTSRSVSLLPLPLLLLPACVAFGFFSCRLGRMRTNFCSRAWPGYR